MLIPRLPGLIRPLLPAAAAATATTLLTSAASRRSFSCLTTLGGQTSLLLRKCPAAAATSLLQHQPSAGMKYVANPKKRCKDCYFEVKDEVLYVLCTTHPRHRQAAKKVKPKWGWTLTHATQGSAGGHGNGRRQMITQQGFRMDF